MAITASMGKELRDMTGAGMMECKKALTEADADMDKAVDLLREWGVAKVAKKAGRATNEGTVMALVAEDGKSGAVIQLNCETDFVSMNEKFKGYADQVARIELEKKYADAEGLKADADVDAIITDCVHVMGENTQLSKAAYVEGGAVCSYIHMGGKIGVLMVFDVEGIDPVAPEFVAYGRDVAMQVAAMSPVAPNRDAVPAEVVAKEMEIYKAQAASSGKPENIQEKIATGRLEKYYAEICLTEQAFVKDGDMTVQQYTDKVAKQLGGSIKVVDFVRFALGE